jgi:hypothetical protein
LFEGKEKLVFKKEDKELLLGHLRPLNEIYFKKFGPAHESFEDQMKFWDEFFENEFEHKSLIYGNDRNEKEKRVGLSQIVKKRLEYLQNKYQMEGFENFKGTNCYRQVMMQSPNEVSIQVKLTNRLERT